MRLLKIDSKGQSMVETMFAVLIAMPMVFWLLELGLFFYTVSVVQYASRAGVQYAVTHGANSATSNCSGPSGGCADGPGSNVVNLVQNVASKSGHMIPTGNIQVRWNSGTSNPGDPVTVSVNYKYQPMIDLPFIPVQISGHATGYIVY